MFNKSRITFIGLILSTLACVEPTDLSLEKNAQKIIFVNAILTNSDEEQIITIAESVPLSGIVYSEEIPGLKVEILIDNAEKIALINQSKGNYLIPKTLKFEIGKTYKLMFERTDGTKYESTPQSFKSAPKIDKKYEIFTLDGIKKQDKNIPGHKIYIDYTDPATEKNNYYWTWTLWERQYVCLTSGNFDYYCRGDCWEIIQNLDVNIANDNFSNGKPVKGKLIAEIPYYQDRGALLEIKQQVVSDEAFRYLQIYQNQTQGTGTLADSPPAKLVGNIRNINNPKDEVAGFFTIAGTSSVKYWLSREDAIGKIRPIGLLGRLPNISPFAVTSTCELSRTRTPVRPIGWQD
jgi:Domain of unknown function (DUF4249)